MMLTQLVMLEYWISPSYQALALTDVGAAGALGGAAACLPRGSGRALSRRDQQQYVGHDSSPQTSRSDGELYNCAKLHNTGG